MTKISSQRAAGRVASRIIAPGFVRRTEDHFSENETRTRVNGLGNALVKHADGKPVSPLAAEAFIHRFSRNLVWERYYSLRWWYLKNQHQFSDDAKLLMHRFLHETAPQQLVPDPITAFDQKLSTGNPKIFELWKSEPGKLTYDVVPGGIHLETAQMDDIDQGLVGDCYFLAAVQANVAKDPDFYKKVIQTNKDGTFSTTFYAQPAAGTFVPVRVTVSPTIPLIDGKPLAVSSTDGDWNASIYEKLWAQFKGTYGAINGGLAADVMSAITGKPSKTEPIFLETSPKVLYEKIKATLARGDLVVLDTYPTDPTGVPLEKGAFLYDAEATQLVADHLYACVGVKEVKGDRFVELRNPKPKYEPKAADGLAADGRADGRFWLPMHKVIRYFAILESGPAASSGPVEKHAPPCIASAEVSPPALS